MKKLPFETIKRKVIVKKEAKSEPAPKRTTEELIGYGIVNIDKPPGPTSHQVSDFVQKILHIKKAGHSGTLDPRVTGVLPVALGKATRIVQALLPAGKEYVGIMHLHKNVEEKKLKEVIKKFTGRIEQMPPIKSSVKRQLRKRDVYYFDIVEIKDKDVLFRVGCQAGTYIRKLCSDVGAKIGGAHMAELRRTKAGCFDESTLVTLQDLTDAFYYHKQDNDKFLRHCIQPIENAVKHLPKVWILEPAIKTICHGADLAIPGVAKFESEINIKDTIAIMTLRNELIALGEARMSSAEIKRSEKGVAVKTKKVFMVA